MRGGGNAFEVSRKKIRKVDGCSRERAQYSEPTTTTVRNLKKERSEMDQLPGTEMHTNLIWSVRGSINADSKKGNVEKSSKFTDLAANFAGSIRGIPFAEIQPRKSGHGNPTAEIHSRKSIRGNPGYQANLRKEDPLKSKQDRKRAQQLAISRLRSFCWLRWRVVETSFGGWSESEA